MSTITLGFSSCPNDTFIFDALVHHKIDTEGLNFELIIADVEELNKMALNNSLNITKLSYYAYTEVWNNYLLLNAGSALGRNNGPLLISRHKIYPDEVNDVRIGIPGRYTTANLLLSIAYPNAQNKKEYLFSDIEEAIASNEIDAGLIIHETRFTYEADGFKKIIDLGEFWEKHSGLPIPLGGIVVQRNLPLELQQKIDRLLRKSIEYAYQNPKESLPYIRQNAQAMQDTVMQKHINLYVNDFSLDLGKEGQEAICSLYEKAYEKNLISKVPDRIFLPK